MYHKKSFTFAILLNTLIIFLPDNGKLSVNRSSSSLFIIYLNSSLITQLLNIKSSVAACMAIFKYKSFRVNFLEDNILESSKKFMSE